MESSPALSLSVFPVGVIRWGVYAARLDRWGVVLVECWQGYRGEELGLLAHRWEVGWRGGFSGAFWVASLIV